MKAILLLVLVAVWIGILYIVYKKPSVPVPNKHIACGMIDPKDETTSEIWFGRRGEDGVTRCVVEDAGKPEFQLESRRKP